VPQSITERRSACAPISVGRPLMHEGFKDRGPLPKK
jgi:hypothetical protein